MEKGGDAAENVLVVTLDNLGQQFWACSERMNFATVKRCEKDCGE